MTAADLIAQLQRLPAGAVICVRQIGVDGADWTSNWTLEPMPAAEVDQDPDQPPAPAYFRMVNR